MSMKGKGGKGGKAKGGGKSTSGGGTIAITHTKDRKTAALNESIVTLRQALFDDLGQNKNVCMGIAAPFLKYDRKGVDVTIEFSAKLSKEEVKWAFQHIKEEMEDKYNSSGYMWDDADKLEQLQEPEARFLIIREALSPEEKEEEVGEGKKKKKPKKGALVGVVHFRFSVQGDFTDTMAGSPSLILWDIYTHTHTRRKGLGKHLLLLLELIARRQAMVCVCVPVWSGDEETLAWLRQAGRGAFLPMEEEMKETIRFDSEEEGFEVYVKTLVVKKKEEGEEVEGEKKKGEKEEVVGEKEN